jgi:hypothetical protein
VNADTDASSSNGAPRLADLDRVAGHVHASLRAARLVQFLGTDDETDPADALRLMTEHGTIAGDEAGAALGLLSDMGARPAAIPAAEPIALDKLDTPDVRELLRLVREALPVAERIDKARGRALAPGQPFAVLGVDLAEEFEHLAIRLETEIFGPADLRQNGPATRE